jgi:hypothetical protein
MEKVVTRAWPRMNCFQPDYALALRCALTTGERVALATLVSSCGLPRLRGPLHSRHALLRVPGRVFFQTYSHFSCALMDACFCGLLFVVIILVLKITGARLNSLKEPPVRLAWSAQ